ncbi:MAG: dethiobiotin synthase [Verrucomicrobiota bacterium]
MPPAFFITGTDTGVGKTVLTALLARYLKARRVGVAAFKPVCSGGRADARALHAALGGALTLAEINPWHFHATLAPTLAAAREKKTVALVQVLGHIRAHQENFAVTLVEGAGGLLSPLGKNFHSRDLIRALPATPIIVAVNKLGAVNHLLLTLEALPRDFRAKAKIVLMSPAKSDAATASNAKLLAEFFQAKKIFRLPWLGRNFSLDAVLEKKFVKRTLAALVAD